MSTFQIMSYIFKIELCSHDSKMHVFMKKQYVMINLNKEVSADEVSSSCGARSR